MEFQQEFAQGNQISGYGSEGIQVNDQCYTQSVLVTADVVETCIEFDSLNKLSQVFERIMAQSPEVVLIGTGATTQFPSASELQPFIHHHIPYEFMATGAACRTYNVLLSEGRHVLALLLFPDS